MVRPPVPDFYPQFGIGNENSTTKLAQCNWIYVSDTGKRYNVGLFHGSNTGHLLVHCNSRIMLIDFNVLQSSTYSFFLEEELCELQIERKENQFFYTFHLNKKVDTPLNRERKAEEKKHWLQSIALFGAILLAAGIFAAGFYIYRGKHEQNEGARLLEETAQEAYAKVFVSDKNREEASIRYSFVADGRSYESTINEPFDRVFQQNMPLESGDEFVVRYAYNRPRINEIDLSRPSERQIEQYFQRVADKHGGLHPQEAASLIQCRLQIAFDLKGVAGLADFYFQDSEPDENPYHNRLSYHRLIRDVPFRQQEDEKCWK